MRYTTVAFDCHECGEKLRGEPGVTGKCGYCDTWIEAPDEDEDYA